MFKEYFILLLLGHVLGDFYFQTKKMSDNKKQKFGWVILHGLTYGLVMVVICFLFGQVKLVVSACAATLIHMLIDILKYIYLKLCKEKTYVKECSVFFIDQALHFMSIMAISYVFVLSCGEILSGSIVENFFLTINVSEIVVLAWILALLIISKPANIMIQRFLSAYRPKSNVEHKDDNNAGRLIGTVERVIILILISIGQYSSIGLVLTAKSIARYDRISKEKDFAEYYLLGT
ncbi:MAG TPA: DUF3307 domain-containing protein [Lachnospiraceae bacterium]|nr:DUF3307 domain-containing protein [Lachnospiraceae bacterium]